MEIKFDKALLWLVPYLYMVSVLYYWGYWGPLGGDAINYYPTSDFIKGIVNPISDTMIFLLTISGVVALAGYVRTRKDSLRWTLIICGIGAVVIFVLHFIPASALERDEPMSIRLRRTFLTMLGTMLAIYIVDSADRKKESPLNRIIRFTYVNLLCLFPLSANVDGALQAWRILHNQEYDYTLIDTDAAPLGLYKYLGKAGDSHFLLTADNSRRVIVSTTKLSSLILVHYSIADASSRKLFSSYQQQLAQLQVHKKALSQQSAGGLK